MWTIPSDHAVEGEPGGAVGLHQRRLRRGGGRVQAGGGGLRWPSDRGAAAHDGGGTGGPARRAVIGSILLYNHSRKGSSIDLKVGDQG